MRMMLLLAVALSATAMVPTSASAHGPGAFQSHALTSFGLSVIVRDAPGVAPYRHPAARHLRPQPWPRPVTHHAPRSGWHKPWRPAPGHFHRPPGGHQRWSHGPGRPARPAVRHHKQNGNAFKHGQRDGRRR
jgi:hypothetical protein